MVPASKWRWDGHAGHFIASDHCRFRLHTRIGDYRISTVGDWYPDGSTEDEPRAIGGGGRTHETYVFRVTGEGAGEVETWSEIDADGYQDCDSAHAGHMAMCRKYARLA